MVATTVMIFGTFDGLHPGHEFVFHEAMKRGAVIAVVARDMNVEMIKGRQARQKEGGRMAAILHKFPEVNVVLGSVDDFLEPIRSLSPGLILLGYDQKLPPGITETDFHCPVERLPAFEPERWKSSLLR